MKFNDYEEQLVYWPRDNKLKNSQISGSASFIDSSIVEDKKSGKTILLADVMPVGIEIIMQIKLTQVLKK